MLHPEDSALDHRSLLPRLLTGKAHISPADKKKNRRSLELYDPPDCTKRGLLISKTADSLTNSAETLRKVIRQDSTDSLKKSLLKTADVSSDAPKKGLGKHADVNNVDNPKKTAKPPDLSTENPSKKGPNVLVETPERLTIQADLTGKEPEEWRKVSSSEQAKRLFFLKAEEPCARRGLLEPVSEEVGRDERSRQARSWYGYGTLPNATPDKTACPRPAEEPRASPGAGRRALGLLPGLRGLAARRHPVRRAASRDSALDEPAPPERQEGLRKCSTVLALSGRPERPEPLRAVNRLRAPSVCSRCSSILSLAGGSRYSLDDAGGGFAPVCAGPIVCKLCLEEAAPPDLTALQGCGCAFCTKCMRAYVEFEVCNGAYEVSCPDARCGGGGALSPDELRRLLPAEALQKHLRFRLNHEVAMDQGRAFCPRAGCDTVVAVRAASPAHCPSCRHDFCPDCNQEWHSGLSCAAASSASAGAGAALLPDGDLIKWCPMCRVPIEKDEGCAQMMCKRCKHVFCWYCLASLDDDFLLRHYDKGPCKNKLGHSRASVIWHRAQVVGIFAGFGLLLLVASPLLLLAAPCIVCCKCRLCNPNGAKNLDDAEEIEAVIPEKEEPSADDPSPSRAHSP